MRKESTRNINKFINSSFSSKLYLPLQKTESGKFLGKFSGKFSSKSKIDTSVSNTSNNLDDYNEGDNPKSGK